MSAVEIAEDIEAIAHLDFEPKCEVADIFQGRLFGVIAIDVVRPCGRPAVCAVICRSCRRRFFSCAEHATSPDVTTVCSRCLAKGPFSEVMVRVDLPVGAP